MRSCNPTGSLKKEEVEDTKSRVEAALSRLCSSVCLQIYAGQGTGSALLVEFAGAPNDAS
jgi:hypothetical protein